MRHPLQIKSKDLTTTLVPTIKEITTQILQKIESLGIIQPPRPMFTPLERRNPKLFCAFHEDIRHIIDSCLALKHALETSIQQGHLSEFCKYHSHNLSSNTESQPTYKFPKVINVISGSLNCWTTSAPKRHKLSNPSLNDDVSLVISLHIEDFVVKRILVDIGSYADILYYQTFLQMNLSDSTLTPNPILLVGFYG